MFLIRGNEGAASADLLYCKSCGNIISCIINVSLPSKFGVAISKACTTLHTTAATLQNYFELLDRLSKMHAAVTECTVLVRWFNKLLFHYKPSYKRSFTLTQLFLTCLSSLTTQFVVVVQSSRTKLSRVFNFNFSWFKKYECGLILQANLIYIVNKCCVFRHVLILYQCFFTAPALRINHSIFIHLSSACSSISLACRWYLVTVGSVPKITRLLTMWNLNAHLHI